MKSIYRGTAACVLMVASVVFFIACDSRKSSGGKSDNTEVSDSGGSSDNTDPAVQAKKSDTFADEELSKSKIAAKEWLGSDKHGTFKAEKRAVAKLTDDVLAAGATGVWVSGPEELNGTELIDHLFVELPADKDKRKKIIDVYNKDTENFEDAHETEAGQKYLVFDWG